MAQVFIILDPDRMITTGQPPLADKLALAAIVPTVDHQGIIHVKTNPVINSDIEALGSFVEGPATDPTDGVVISPRPRNG
jgi:hypothetical protein